MKSKLFIAFILMFNFCLEAQSKKFIKATNSDEFKFLTDQNDFLLNDNIESVILKSANYGYEIIRNKKNNRLFLQTDLGNVITMIKQIKGYELLGILPKLSLGWVYKKYFFSGNTIEDGIIVKVSTEIHLHQYAYNVSESLVDETFTSIINVIINNLNSNFNLTKNKTDFSQKNKINIFLEAYDFLESYDLSTNRINQHGVSYDVKRVFRYGKRQSYSSENRFKTFILGFTQEDDIWSTNNQLFEIMNNNSKSKQETLDVLRFTINGKDLREVNTYNLKSMVQLFLADCKKNNIPIPSIDTLKATFEPLEGNTIAAAYASNNDSAIVIKVDPEKWANSSTEKKWYILYHELGHDVLNLDHGEGGKMMFNFADREYSWDEFVKDKNYMFNFMKNK